MAERRGDRTAPEEPEPAPGVPPARHPPWWRVAILRVRVRAALAALRGGARMPARLGGMRTRLALIAVFAAVAGAATMIGVEEATRSDAKQLAADSRAWLGVYLGSAPGQPGALVLAPYPGSPAAEAGIEPGDVITSVDGRTVAGPSQLESVITGLRAGAHVVLAVQRFGGGLTIDVTLGSRPSTSP
jgi:membrane-associated protease RseP (regulator of RpoE activity)